MMYKTSMIRRVWPSVLLAGALIWGSAWIVSTALQSNLDVAVVMFGASVLLFATCWLLPGAFGWVVCSAGVIIGSVPLILLMSGGLYWQAFVDFLVIVSLSVASYLIGLLWSMRHLPRAEQLEVLQVIADRLHNLGALAGAHGGFLFRSVGNTCPLSSRSPLAHSPWHAL